MIWSEFVLGVCVLLWYVNYPESETFLTPMYNVDFSYPAHLHGCFEVTFCAFGAVEVTLGEQVYALHSGNGILIPPNTLHSYLTKETSAYHTILFSRDLLPELAAMFVSKLPEHYDFVMDDGLNRQVLEFYDSNQTLFGGKSLLYRAAESFLRDNPFAAADKTDDDLTRQILGYIQEHLCEEFTLQDMADRLGYSYFYISKRIRQVFHVPFTTLVSQYRVARVKMLLEGGKCSVSQAAFNSGFGSIRSFNRIFRELTGMTPSQYLANPSRRQTFRLDSQKEG